MENSEKQRKTENISEKQKTYQKTDSKTAKNSEKQKTEMENCFSWFIDVVSTCAALSPCACAILVGAVLVVRHQLVYKLRGAAAASCACGP